MRSQARQRPRLSGLPLVSTTASVDMVSPASESAGEVASKMRLIFFSYCSALAANNM
jgi:hypothetical protein